MRVPVAPAVLAAALALLPAAAGYAPALSQDFSITNPEEPSNAGRRDLMRQLQAWWDVHGYYPRHASQNDEGGTVKLRLVIEPDGNIWTVSVVESSGSRSLDQAGTSVFHAGFVRPFPAGVPEASVDLSLHYVLAHRHDQPVAAGATPVSFAGPFTITNDPVRSPILQTMLQRTCTGTVATQGIRNHPIYGVRDSAEAIFFRRPDGTSWVKFNVGGYPILARVLEIGKLVQWTGREEYRGHGTRSGTIYTVWPDGDNKLSGRLDIPNLGGDVPAQGINREGTVELTCATEVVPPVEWNAWFVNTIQAPSIDPP